MDTTTITVGTLTYAIKARKLLLKKGVPTKLVKVDTMKSDNGCAYGIKLPSSYFYTAVMELKNNGIEYSVHTT